MKITTTIDSCQTTNTAIALGFFDGVHNGHKSVITTMVDIAKKENLAPMVFTFSAENDMPESKNIKFLLQSDKKKYEVFEKLGVSEIKVPSFSTFKMLTPEQFVCDLLHKKFKAKVLLCGENYRFGKGASGDVNLLRELGERYDIKVLMVPPVLYNDEIISSTRIKNAILSGEMEQVSQMLGTPFMIEGVVSSGNKLGRTINFPTINVSLVKNHIVPKYGVYVSVVTINGHEYFGVTNIGVKPTVGVNTPATETHILNFSKDVYGEIAEIKLLKFVRAEMVFSDLGDLQKQIEADTKFAVEYISKFI